ncbi:L,D-transpeptidase family protein [Schaedlerella sp.]|uniref:L,D-transpeptidase family protein n=1 Tax=Schaedlerella sp. TaxID=2676057 RepID=UPI0037450657
MSKNAKDQNDDSYSGEEINYADYYLDDEDDYLDEDEDINTSFNENKREDPARVEKNTSMPDNKSRLSENDPAGADESRKKTDIQYQTSGSKEWNSEVRDQEDMKKESAKNSDKMRNDPGKKDTGNKKTSQEKTGAQKNGAGKSEAQKASTGKTGAQNTGTGTQKSSTGKNDAPKSSPGKSGPQKDAARKTGASKGTAGKSGPQKSGAGRQGAKRNSGNPAKSSGAGRRPKKSGVPIPLLAAGVFVGVLAAAYIGVSVYFTSHFYMNTEINGHDFSMKTAADVKEYIEQQVQGYSLTILEKDNKTDSISGEEISLKYNENKDIENVLKKQNAFLWPQAFFVKNSSKATVEVSYDREALEDKIRTLQAVKAEQIPPTSAYPKFNGTEYVVEPEVTGTEVNQELLREKIHQYISEFQPELDMVGENCYALPKYTSESGDVTAACNEMNQYLKASITYSMDQPVVVDKTLISEWVTADAEMKVTFNEGAVREWLREFGKQYDTVGKTRSITSPWGKTVEVSGGTYGWSVDEEAEFPALVNSIKNGEVVTREPIYVDGQRAASRGPQDWGSTYAEVDLSGQHMWFIVDGVVALETDVVTGVPTPARETPSGVYSILDKELNSTLVGEIDPATGQPEYRTPVAYWMRVTWSGIGFHDATWQPAFGGSLYASGAGSHGCINMPLDQAGALYNMLPVGTPVIIHY